MHKHLDKITMTLVFLLVFSCLFLLPKKVYERNNSIKQQCFERGGEQLFDSKGHPIACIQKGSILK